MSGGVIVVAPTMGTLCDPMSICTGTSSGTSVPLDSRRRTHSSATHWGGSGAQSRKGGVLAKTTIHGPEQSCVWLHSR